jgi:hypothetical protein
VTPQSDLLTNLNGDIDLDYIGRYEELQLSLDTIFENLGLPSITLKVRNSSDHIHYREYYDSHLQDLVERFYAVDLDLFNYEF